jgi:hypothetical protein
MLLRSGLATLAALDARAERRGQAAAARRAASPDRDLGPFGHSALVMITAG